MTPAGERVELGIADVRQSGRRPGVVAGLRASRGGERSWGDGGSSAGGGSRAPGAATDGGCTAWRSCRGAVVGVVQGGTGPRVDFVLGRSSHVVVSVSGVLQRQVETDGRRIKMISNKCRM